ncbi:MAG: zf-HC2 domain-containing protein [Anaerolineae bacterium]|nr:zf-HC2 domain-containing protein [Anaerolineae bacterium]
MFEWLQDIFKSAETRRQERITAYVDGELTPAQRAAIEAEMARDPQLQADIIALQRLRGAVRRLPRRPVPRNFVLDPSQFRAPAATRSQRAYPTLRVATALAGIAFIFLFTLTLLQDNTLSSTNLAELQAVAVTNVVADDQEEVVVTVVADVQVEIETEPAEEEMAAGAASDTATDESQSARIMAAEEEAVAETMESTEDGATEALMVEESADMMATEPESAAVESPPTTMPTPEPTPTATLVATDTPEAVAKAVVPTATAAESGESMPELLSERDQTEPASQSTTLTLLIVAGVVFLVLFAITFFVNRRR